MKSTSSSHGFTRTELVVALVVAGAFIFILSEGTICLGPPLIKSQMTQALNNAKQIHLATFSMAADRISTGEKGIGWPGDIVATGTMPCTVTSFIKVLVKNEYLKVDNLKLFAAPGITPFTGTDVNKFSAIPGKDNNCAFTVYCVQETDAADAIFLSTMNATLNVSDTTFTVDAKAQPFGDNGYVVFLKGGTGEIINLKRSPNPHVAEGVKLRKLIPKEIQKTPCKMALSGTSALMAE